jgi:hypothetical protein
MENDLFPRWTYYLLGLVAAFIGLASSANTAQFFILGLAQLETDHAARDALMMTGLLMIATELMAFGLAALLPSEKLRALRSKLILCGLLLLAFETTTIYITQVALAQTANASAAANLSRIHDLRISVNARRAAAQTLRENGAVQSGSTNPWARHLGVSALKDALSAENSIEVLTAELAKLESASRPTMTAVLGAQGVLVYSVSRAVLISVMGLVMFATAGALCRAARSNQPSKTTAAGAKVTAESTGFSNALNSSAMRFAVMPITALVAPMAMASTPASTPASTVAEYKSLASDFGDNAHKDQARYMLVSQGVACGSVKPSVRGIQAVYGGGTLLARRYLQRLETDGITEKSRVGWTVNLSRKPNIASTPNPLISSRIRAE